MQSITVKGPETQLLTQAQAARSQFYQPSVPRASSQRIEASDYPAMSQCAPEAEKHANREVELDNDHRHWSSTSQPYAPADILLQYLRDGWLLGDKVLVQVVQCFSWRCVEVYHFRLMSGREHILMPIIANPVILRFVMERGLAAIRIYTDYEVAIDP
jgi:hypothetical protein